jgi:putative acetyltransferase
MRVGLDDPLAADVRALLGEHLADMLRTSPPESVHALDPEVLAQPGVVFLAARDDDGTLLGCGAVKRLPGGDAEVKSMRTADAARGRGVASAVLVELITRARADGVARLLLETGTEPFFASAVRLYLRHGFTPTGPFGDYTDDPHSRYLALAL